MELQNRFSPQIDPSGKFRSTRGEVVVVVVGEDVGVFEGSVVAGGSVGRSVGVVEGPLAGEPVGSDGDGILLGIEDVGEGLGSIVGKEDVGGDVGISVGEETVGSLDGTVVVGAFEGSGVASSGRSNG